MFKTLHTAPTVTLTHTLHVTLTNTFLLLNTFLKTFLYYSILILHISLFSCAEAVWLEAQYCSVILLVEKLVHLYQC